MSEKNSKQVVYRYNGDPTSEETETDLDGAAAPPKFGEIINRKGKYWKVVHILEHKPVTEACAGIPIVWILLSEWPLRTPSA